MKAPFSVVIVCKNEAQALPQVLRSLQGITDNVVVYDNGSTDGTMGIAKSFTNVQWQEGAWEGFGKTKQRATALAQHDWILSLDADEALDDALQQSLKTVQLNDAMTVYRLAFKNFLGDKALRWGEWGGDAHVRLFNRKKVQWDDAPVHEKLLLPQGVIIKKIKGHVLHRTVKNLEEYSRKTVEYALLNAGKYHARGKRSTFLKRHAAPIFTFVKFYIFHLGFLDGWPGYICAKMTAHYTFLKYARLHELAQNNGGKS